MQPKTILEYLTYLNNAFFVRRICPMDMLGKKQFQIGEKYYLYWAGVGECGMSSFAGVRVYAMYR